MLVILCIYRRLKVLSNIPFTATKLPVMQEERDVVGQAMK